MQKYRTKNEKCIIFSAPSGSGKTTIAHALLERVDNLVFSVSACSRKPRDYEVEGKDYYFLSVEEFKNQIEKGAFVEWQEVYENNFYGTLKKEVERLWQEDKVVLFDVDVYGGINLKKYFKDQALSFFIQPPSIEILEKRLKKRQTETQDSFQMRIEKAKEELGQIEYFDRIVVNDVLEDAVNEVTQFVQEFIQK